SILIASEPVRLPFSQFRSATGGGMVRRHNSVLAPSEKRLLEWIARRLPRWVTPDGLTLVALGAMLVAAAAFAEIVSHPLEAAIVVVAALAVNWFGDSLDGTIARVRRCERPC